MLIIRFTILTFIFSISPRFLLAQRVGAWRDHFAYTKGIDVVVLPKHFLCATSDGLIFVDEELTTISKVNGLSDVGLSAMMYNASLGTIIVGYESGLIDVLSSANPDKIIAQNNNFTITAWKNSNKYGSKKIHKFLQVGHKIYAATASCILELDGREVTADFSIDEQSDTLAVFDLVLYKDFLVAATHKGLYVVHKDNPQLYYYKIWEKRLPNTHVISLAVYEDKLYALQSNGNLLVTTDLLNFAQQKIYSQALSLSLAEGDLWLATATALHNVFSPKKTLTTYSGITKFSPFRIVSRGNQRLIADKLLGGVFVNANTRFSALLPNGMLQNDIDFVTQQGGVILGTTSNSLSLLPQQGKWRSIVDNLREVNASIINPNNQNQFFLSTSSGVAQVSNQTLEGLYLNNQNVQAMAFSSSNYLFAFSSQSTTPVNIRSANGDWESLLIDNLQYQNLGNCVFNEELFVGIANKNRIYVYNLKDKIAKVFSVQLNTGENFMNTNILSISTDRNGELWVGTEEGVVVYPYINPNLSDTPTAIRVRVPTEIDGYASYLLMYEKVTAIAVDGGNRKWFGTNNAGVFLQSDDGVEQIYAFSEHNSPLPSNKILSITINSETGEVLFATDKGMVGYYSDAVEGRNNFNEAKVYPNPARPNMNEVTITNLMENSSLRITDVGGNLVFFGIANGGSITWDLRSLTGKRVATGIYLIFLSDKSANKGKVLKLLVVN
ncbi:MAG: two-component regulator propeller domain-containing protein [Bacteroidales bacterium]